MEYRVLGKTGLKVSRMGFGGIRSRGSIRKEPGSFFMKWQTEA